MDVCSALFIGECLSGRSFNKRRCRTRRVSMFVSLDKKENLAGKSFCGLLLRVCGSCVVEPAAVCLSVTVCSAYDRNADVTAIRSPST